MNKMTATWTGGLGFTHQSASGHSLVTDAPVAVGGSDTAATPMELVILALLGCTGVDVTSILTKMKEPLEALEVSAEFERAETHPRIYTRIHLKYTVKGAVSVKKLERAIKLSEENYCSVTAMLRSTTEITSEYELLG